LSPSGLRSRWQVGGRERRERSKDAVSAHTYQLPVQVVIQVMQGLRERVLLCAPMPALPELGLPEGVASLVVDAQGVQGCVIRELRTGRTLAENQEALHLVEHCGVLPWMLQPPQQGATWMRPAGASLYGGQVDAAPIPARRVTLTPEQLHRLPPVHKKVFALVDGTRSVAQIAHLLSRSPQEMVQVLLDLQRHHLIDL
jgi:hypothetical protein